MKANLHTDIMRLMREIQEQFDTTHFVETGTNVGETAEWASDHFEQVITIELDSDLYETAIQKRGDIENITFVKGKSQEELPAIVSELNGPAIFHLDAHCGGKWSKTAGESLERPGLDPCPILDELEALQRSAHTHFLFIDDARVFTAPRRAPFDMDQWPDLQTVIRAIEAVDPDYHVIIYKDEIIAVPPAGREFVRERIRDYRTVERTPLVRLKLWIMNKLWKYASLSGPTRDF